MQHLRRLLFSRAWVFALALGVFAFSFHKVGSIMGFYPRFFWFQMLAHFLSATGMALLLARFGLDTGLRGTNLWLFVIGFSIIGAVGWKFVEYDELWPNLIWWGIEDSLLDLTMNAFGVGLVLVLLKTRLRPVIDPTETTPTLGEFVSPE